MRNLLVTGGAGFIGSNFVRYWLRNHDEDRVTVLDALTYAGNMANLAGLEGDSRFTFVQGDIRDRSALIDIFRDQSIDTVVHLAAESHVDRSIDGPDVFLQTNVVGTHELLKAAWRHWSETGPDMVRFHHVSTDEVYGSLGWNDPPFTENSPCSPNSPYAATKAASDHMVRAYYQTYGLPVTTSNCSNNYGPYQFPEKLIPVMIFNALAGKSLPIYGDGSNVRDWLFVEDHCRAIEAILKHGAAGAYYNVGGGCERTNLDLVHTLCAVLDDVCPRSEGGSYREQMEFVEDRPGHDHRYAVDFTRLREDTGWSPETNLTEGLRRTVEWYMDNPAWCESVGAGEIATQRRGLGG